MFSENLDNNSEIANSLYANFGRIENVAINITEDYNCDDELKKIY